MPRTETNMMTTLKVLCVVATFTLGSCGVALGKDDDATLQSIVSETRSGDLEAVHTRLASNIRTPEALVALGQVRDLLAEAREPCSRSLISATTFRIASVNGSSATGRRVTARHKLECPNATMQVDIQLWIEADSPYAIENFVVTPISAQAAAQAAEFSLAGKSPRHYAFLAAALVSPLLMLAAVLGTIFTKGFKRKWLWGIISFAGIGKFSMVWNSGAIGSNWLTLNLIGFGIMRGGEPLAPWIVSLTPPLGAVLVLSLLWPRWAGIAPDDASAPSRE